jgi:hypothetical protein
MATTGKQLSSLPDASGFGGSNELLTWVGEGLAQKVTRDDFVASLPENRQSATAYTAGNIVGNAGLPNGYYLECTTAGITAATALTISGSVTADVTTFSDGTVTWTVRKNMNSADLGYRQPSTAYTTGNIAYHSALPTGWYLECTTAGTTGSGALSISSPSIGGTVSDGSVTWVIRQTASTKNLAGFLIGNLKTDTNQISSNDDKYITIIGGDSSSDSPFIFMNGNNGDASTVKGRIVINAQDLTKSTQLTLDPNGELMIYNSSGNTADLAGSAIVAKSLGSNGYIKYASGLILQWGQDILTANGQEFPLNISFSNSKQIFVTGFSEGSVYYFGAASELSTFTVGCNITPNKTPFRWFAIGY